MKYTLKSGKIFNIPDADIDKLEKGWKVSRKEAIQIWLDDWAIDHETQFNKLTDEEKREVQSEECRILDEKAKTYRRENAKSDKARAKSNKPKTVHVADEKKMVFATVVEALKNAELDYSVEKENKLILVKVNDKTIKLDFVEQGKYKKGGAKK